MGQAMEIGMLEAVGLSWQDEPKMMEMIRSVTADEVQSVAKRYFSEDSLSVATLDPLPLDDKPRPGRSAGLRH